MKELLERLPRLASAFLLVVIVNCSGDPTTPTPPELVATTLAANSPISYAGVAGAAVTPPPSVVIHDQNGSPMGGVTVTFAVVSGGGSVSGATLTTDGSGIATISSWTLGPETGENVLRATSGALAAITFTATSSAGAAASLTRNAGNGQTAATGTAVPVRPSVVVRDANGNLKPGVQVTFAVVSGGGSVTGAAAVTNASGVATVGSWILGPSAGVNSLSATVAGLPPVTFTAAAISTLCTATFAHPFGTTTSGTLTSDDCRLSDGYFVDYYTTGIPGTGVYLFRQSAAFDTYLLLAMPDGTSIGFNDDDETGTNSSFKAILPAGNYLLAPGTHDAGVTGDYTIASSVASADVTGCERVFVVRNVTTAQNLGSGDCDLPSPDPTPIYADLYFVFLDAGTSVTINMSSTVLDSFLQLVRLDGTVLAENDDVDGTTKNSRITFTATQANYYAIFARSNPSNAAGAYSLTIQ